VQKRPAWVVQGDPGAVSIADLVIDPDNGRPAALATRGGIFQCTPLSASWSSGQSTTGN
jgi:hypothetical protein